jgi:hypothetical protein
MTMDILTIALSGFILMEVTNVLMLYFRPASRRGNGVGVFRAYEKSKTDPEVHALVTYLVNWVAGTKLIFLLLLVVIVLTGNAVTKAFGAAALILSIVTFYWRLYPAIKKMDAEGTIEPAGYAKTLGIMITGILLVLAAALAVFLLGRRGG